MRTALGVLIPASEEQEVAAQVDVAVHGLLSRGRREEKEKGNFQIAPWTRLKLQIYLKQRLY